MLPPPASPPPPPPLALPRTRSATAYGRRLVTRAAGRVRAWRCRRPPLAGRRGRSATDHSSEPHSFSVEADVIDSWQTTADRARPPRHLRSNVVPNEVHRNDL
ncbi:hypothetical protein GWI33_007717 [Rhynchophorus ferrugineus]|uniref:Uncharacterized protein n=1 Tax=Rhynchophorus ferrugineus TaxID=354439 RepID=A0A834IJX6_RHYFE|nr:hypothetical protein GWI33_007717 [Rhynchophorus ferrugineus]